MSLFFIVIVSPAKAGEWHFFFTAKKKRHQRKKLAHTQAPIFLACYVIIAKYV